MDHPRPWLRYVEASDLDNSTFDFDGLDVENSSGYKLDDVDGFILDADTGRPYYVVVDSKGWFSAFVDGQQVTLLDLNLDELLRDQTLFAKMQGAKTADEMRAVLKDAPGLKINVGREATIEFTPAK